MSIFSEEQIYLFILQMIRSKEEANRYFNGEIIINHHLQICNSELLKSENPSHLPEGQIKAEKFYLNNLNQQNPDAIILKFNDSNNTEYVIHIEILNESITEGIVNQQIIEQNSLTEEQKMLDINIKPKNVKLSEIPQQKTNKIITQLTTKSLYHRDVIKKTKYNKKRINKKNTEIKYKKGRLK